MKTSKKIINDVLNENQELAANYVFPTRVSKKSKKEIDDELMQVLSNRRNERNPEDRLRASLLQLRFQIEKYLNEGSFDSEKTFGAFLKLYIRELNIKQQEFAKDIDVKPAELSSYINNHRTPPEHIIIRLEIHSRNTIPAIDWYQLIEKVKLHKLNTNEILRNQERKFVKKTVEFT